MTARPTGSVDSAGIQNPGVAHHKIREPFKTSTEVLDSSSSASHSFASSYSLPSFSQVDIGSSPPLQPILDRTHPVSAPHTAPAITSTTSHPTHRNTTTNMMSTSLHSIMARLVLLLVIAGPLLSYAAVANARAAAHNAPGAVKVAPRQAQPTRRMGQRKVKKAEPLKKKDYSSFLCPGGSVACPVYNGDDVTPESVDALEKSLSSLADWFKMGFECVELETELNSCGGCLAMGKGQDCSTIANARATGCESSSCIVYSCYDGYVVSPDRSTCVKKGTTTPATPITAVQPDSKDQHVLERRR